jgi:short-subunit dehydrogenase
MATDLILVDINGETVGQVAREVEALGVKAHTFCVDVTDRDQVKNLAGTLRPRWGEYACTKFAVDGYYEALRYELRAGSMIDCITRCSLRRSLSWRRERTELCGHN